MPLPQLELTMSSGSIIYHSGCRWLLSIPWQRMSTAWQRMSTAYTDYPNSWLWAQNPFPDANCSQIPPTRRKDPAADSAYSLHHFQRILANKTKQSPQGYSK